MRNILIILFLIIGSAFAQEVVYTHYSTDNGLASSHTSQILQDDEDYIWISSSNGVMRFDGYTFDHYDVNNHLPENDIVGMYKDERGVVWFLGSSGLLSCFKDDTIAVYPHNDKILRTLEDYETIDKGSFLVQDNAIEFNVHESGRFRIDSLGQVFQIFSTKDNINIIDIRDDQLRYFISAQNKEIKIVTDINEYIFTTPNFSVNEPTLCKRKGDTIFLANRNKLYQVSNNRIDSLTFTNAIISLQIDNEESLWLGFDSDGALCYKTADINQEPYCSEFKGSNISSIIRDKFNSIWLSSTNNGVFFVPSENFRKVTTLDGLTDNNVTRLDFSNNYLWAISGNHSIARLHFYGLKSFDFSNPEFSTITDVYWYNGYLWISFKDKLTYYKGEELVELYKIDYSHGSHSVINSITNGVNDEIWIGKSNGFACIKDRRLIFESATQNFQNLNVNQIVAEPNGSLWLACKNGLWKFEDNKLSNFNIQFDLLSKNIIDLVKDDRTDALWLGINGVGVVKILNDSVWTIKPENGLVSNSITSLASVGDYLWVGTREGVSRINVEANKNNKHEILNITTKDGLISNEINDILISHTHVFVATNKGLGFFDFRKHKPDNFAPEVLITSIFIDKEPVPTTTGKIDIDYFTNNININFKSIFFKTRGRLKYRFRIKGLDKDWTYTENLNATYPFLPSGEYVFQVEAANEKERWNNNPTEIALHVESPFWLKWWFFASILLGIAIIFFIIYKVRLQTRRNRERVRREINEYRQMALTRQMNPHFIFNSLNAIQHYILQNDIMLSNKFLTKFSKLIRLILDNSQSTLVPIDKEMVALKLYLDLESLRFKEKMNFTIEINEEIDTLGVKIPPMLIQPFIENAVWHGLMNKEGDGGEIKVLIDLIDDNIICTIIDNGIGRKKSYEINQKRNRTHKSMGTSITQNRIELINSIYKKNISIEYDDPVDENGQSLGTVVKIIFNK